MLQRATLGGIPGVADLSSRSPSAFARAWRGTFVFRAEDERRIAQLTGDGPTVFETMIEGERRRVPVKVLSFTTSGLAFFEGSGVPT